VHHNRSVWFILVAGSRGAFKLFVNVASILFDASWFSLDSCKTDILPNRFGTAQVIAFLRKWFCGGCNEAGTPMLVSRRTRSGNVVRAVAPEAAQQSWSLVAQVDWCIASIPVIESSYAAAEYCTLEVILAVTGSIRPIVSSAFLQRACNLIPISVLSLQMRIAVIH